MMELHQIGGALWRQRLLVLLVLAVTAAAVAAGVALAPKTYRATAVLAAAADPATLESPDDLDALRGTIAELASSRALLTEVQGELDVERDVSDLRSAVSAQWVSGTILIQVVAEDADPQVAADLANQVAITLPFYDPSTDAFRFTQTNAAQPPRTYSSPNLLLAIGGGAALALVLTVVAAVARDRRTATVDDGAVLEDATGAPLLAHVGVPRDATTLPALYPGTAAADVFRQLRIALEAQAAGDPVSRVVVAGVTPGEVNVWLGANLAISLANVGRTVLLVDGRIGPRHGRPIAAEPDTPGLFDVLAGTELSRAVSPGPVELLSVLPAGDAGSEPYETMLETVFADKMAEAEAAYDVVIVLAPALESCDDARVMAARGSLLMVVPEGQVSAPALRAHADRVRSVGAGLLGSVLVGRRAERVLA
ncbi:Wzz/FepE/Etk N-terminal domain-containing protein [Nocardioides abyssi]|nr:Wzz/FepE/Etk N-terminal domain-containing protein [Nocardioides abyssi]